MKHNTNAIPSELKATHQWLGYKDTKAPRAAFGNFHLASYAKPENHSDYATALSAVANGALDGIGMAVTEYDPFVIIDLDACRNPDTGKLSKFAAEIVQDMDTYTEVSNSGKGLHIVCRSYVDGNYKANDEERAAGKAIEFFSTAGYVILTGDALDGYGKLQNVPRAKLQNLTTSLRMTRKQTKTYDRTPPPDLLDDDKANNFETYSSLGPFATLVLNADENPSLADKFPRDKDGALDRSKALFLASVNMRDAGYTVAEAYTLLMGSEWVSDYMDEKSDGWLWRYVVEPAYKSHDGEVPKDELPKTMDAEFVTQADLVQSLRPVDWLIDGVLEARATGLLSGAHSTYKSTIAIDWVHAVASGRPWLGRPARKGAAVVIAGEGVRGLSARSNAWGKEHSMSQDDLAALPVLWSKAAVQVMDAERMGRAVVTIKDMLEDRYGCKEPDLVVVDTLNKNFAGGDENSASDITTFFERLARAFPKSCILVVHHFGKDKAKGSRGSSALDAGGDFLYHVAAEGKDVTLTARKMKDADKPDQIRMKAVVLELPTQVPDETTTGVTISGDHRSTFVMDMVGTMKQDLRVAAVGALAALARLGGTPTRKEWVDAMLADHVAAESWDQEDKNNWRVQLNKLVAAMVSKGLVDMVEDENNEGVYSARLP